MLIINKRKMHFKIYKTESKVERWLYKSERLWKICYKVNERRGVSSFLIFCRTKDVAEQKR